MTWLALLRRGPQSTSLASAAGLETYQVADKSAGVALLTAKGGDTVKAVVEVGTTGTDPTSVSLTALTSVPSSIVKAFSAQPHVDLIAPPKADNGAMIGIGIGFSVVFFFVSITFGMSIAQSVVEEKETRIVEILVAAIPVRALLAGRFSATPCWPSVRSPCSSCWRSSAPASSPRAVQ